MSLLELVFLVHATIKTLFQFAQSSGVGASMRIIAKQAKNISKLFFVQAPDKFIFDLSKVFTIIEIV